MIKQNTIFIGLVDLSSNKGDSNHFRKLTNYMKNQFEIHVISFTDTKLDNFYKLNSSRFKFIRVLIWNLSIAIKIFQINKESKISTVYFRESGLVISPYFMCKLLGIKLIIEINGVNVDDLPFSKKLTIPLFKYLYKFSNGFVASRGYSFFIQNYFNVPPMKICKVNLGHNYNFKDGVLSFKKYEIPTLVFIGNLTRYQGLELFIKGFNEYIQNYSDHIQLFIYGDGSDKGALLKIVQDLNLTEKVKFFERVEEEDLGKILAPCHIGISPFSPNRGQLASISALKTYDYMLNKLPILTSSMDEMSDFLVGNNIGKSISIYTEIEIAKCINIILRKENLQESEKVFRNNFKKWVNDFSWDSRFEKINLFIQHVK
jgi:glycosyltransferase involved in cell wall biosynthesis